MKLSRQTARGAVSPSLSSLAVKDDALELNRASWDSRASVHGQDRLYDAAGLVAGTVQLDAFESAAFERAVGEVTGLRICHLQCHLGFDSIVLARAGAEVTGIDFSPVSLAKASDLAGRSGVEITFIECDACDPPHSQDGKFDVVYATIGVFAWIADIDAWMAAAARLARPSGHLMVVELHPLVTMFETFDPPVTDFPYNFDGPHRFDRDGTYVEPGAQLGATSTVQYAHGLAEVVASAIEAGFDVRYLEEHTASPRDYFGGLTPEPDGQFRLRLGSEPLPILYTLIGRRR
jgi:ubiquinone/menaquinone biosynthesis C-methylase UbiE